MKTLTRFLSRIPTFFAVALSGMFLSGWFAARRIGNTMLPEEWSGGMFVLILFSFLQNLGNDICRIRSRSNLWKHKERTDSTAREAETGFAAVPHGHQFRLPILVSILPTYAFFQAIFAFICNGWSLFRYPTEGNVYLILAMVSFAVTVLNLVNDHEHAAVLRSVQRATITPAEPPPLSAAKTSGGTSTGSAAPKWLLPVGRSPWAIAAGYLGLVSFLLLPAPFALLFGILGLRDIRGNPNLCGKGRAWLGIIAGSVFSVFIVAGYLGLFSR